MAPNRKSTDIFTNSAALESLKTAIQPKYLPLTTEISQQEQVVVETIIDPKKEKEPPTVSYWDWPADTTEVAKEVAIKDEEESAINDFFSSSRLESNLMADSLRRNTEATTKTISEEEAGETLSYWDWSKTGYDVDSAVESETDSQDSTQQGIPENHCEDCCQTYWDWTPEEHMDIDHGSSPSHRLHSIVANSQKKFVRRHSHLSEPREADASHLSDCYWHWLEVHNTNSNQ